VWSGKQAQERGLIDHLGGLRDAVADAAGRAKLGTDFQLRYVEKSLGTLDRFLLSVSDSASAHVVAKFDLSLPQSLLLGDADLRRPLRMLQNLSAGKPAVFAYCFCEVR
jgi:protease-4